MIATFAAEVEADGGRFLLLTIPAPEQVYDDRWRQVLANAGEAATSFDRDHPQRRLAEIAAAAGVPMIPLLEAFRSRAPSATLEAEDEWLYLSGIGHLNEEGQRLAAAELYEALSRALPEPAVTGASAE